MSGWIKLHRKILDHWIASEPELLAMFVRLLMEANHCDKKRLFNGNLVEIKRGQLIFGRDAFSVKSGISVAKIRRYISMLKTDGMINQQITSKYSIISIVNYDQYQVTDQQNTSKTPANDQQTTTPKECKELKEVPPISPKGEKRSAIGIKQYLQDCEDSGVLPIPEDDTIFEYAEKAKIPIDFLHLCWREFESRNLANGKRYKDWRAAFRNCVRGDWYKIWWFDGNGECLLSKSGRQAQNVEGSG